MPIFLKDAPHRNFETNAYFVSYTADFWEQQFNGISLRYDQTGLTFNFYLQERWAIYPTENKLLSNVQGGMLHFLLSAVNNNNNKKITYLRILSRWQWLEWWMWSSMIQYQHKQWSPPNYHRHTAWLPSQPAHDLSYKQQKGSCHNPGISPWLQ